MAPKENSTPSSAPRATHPADGVHVSRPTAAPTRAAQPAAPAQAPAAAAPAGLLLPPTVVSRSDVSRCLRELQQLDDFFHQASVRGQRVEQLPKISHVLESLVKANGLNLLHPQSREQLKPFLTQIKASGPVVHLTFPSAASSQFIARILEWFRGEAHPHTMLHIGLQPELAAGFTVRTTNKSFDFSFRKKFEQSKQKLVEALDKLGKAPEQTKLADANATVEPEVRL